MRNAKRAMGVFAFALLLISSTVFIQSRWRDDTVSLGAQTSSDAASQSRRENNRASETKLVKGTDAESKIDRPNLALSDTDSSKLDGSTNNITRSASVAKAPDDDAVTEARRLTLARYGPLFDQLQLPSDKYDQLVKLLTDTRLSSIDVASAYLKSGYDPRANPDSIINTITAARNEIDSQIKTLLGVEDYGRYTEFLETSSQASIVNDLSSRLAQANLPLDQEQANLFSDLLRAHHETHLTVRAVQEAETYLSPPQLQILKAMRTEGVADSRRRIQTVKSP